MARFAVALSLVLSVVYVASAQNSPQSDPQAVTLASQSIASMTGGASVGDITIAGSGTWTSGSNVQNVTVTLMAKGSNESRTDIRLSDGQQSDIRNNSNGSAQGEWLDSSGNPTYYAPHNCWTDPSWFSPILSSLNMSDPTVILSYIGVESYQGTSVYHLRSYKNPSGLSPRMTSFVNSVSAVDFYLDFSSLLPRYIAFSAHPDDDAGTNIPVVVTLSNFTSVNGILVPFRIQKSWNGNQLGDFTVSSVSFNSGLSDDLFSIQ